MRAHTCVYHMQKHAHLQTHVHMSLLHASCIATDQIRQMKDHLKLYKVHVGVSSGILFYFVFGFVFSLNGPTNFIEANRDKRFGFTTQLMTMGYCVLWMRQQQGAGNWAKLSYCSSVECIIFLSNRGKDCKTSRCLLAQSMQPYISFMRLFTLICQSQTPSPWEARTIFIQITAHPQHDAMAKQMFQTAIKKLMVIVLWNERVPCHSIPWAPKSRRALLPAVKLSMAR